MSPQIRRLFHVLASILLAGSAYAQTAAPPTADPEAGRPLVRNYTPGFTGGGQNWAMVQDNRGVLYVGSGAGVLEYDGATWRLVELPNQAVVRSVAADASGRVFAGGVNEFGYLDADVSGGATYVSLLDKVPADAKVQGDVWRTFATPNGVYFQTEHGLYRWAGSAIRAWKPLGDHFNRSSYVEGHLYVPQPGVGITELVGDTFKPLPNTERFGDEQWLVILPFDATHLLLGTRFNGLFLYDGTAARPFRTDVDGILAQHALYRGTTLPDGSFALATVDAGAVVLDRQGRLVTLLNRAAGLRSDSVYYPYVDREGGLWLALGRGIARVDMPPAGSYFDESLGFNEPAADMIRHDGRLYVANSFGVSYLQPKSPQHAQASLEPIAAIRGQAWSFAEVADPSRRGRSDLLVASSEGLFRVDGTSATLVHGDDRASLVKVSSTDPERVWVAYFDGLASVRRVNGQWQYEGRVAGVPDEVRSLFETADGVLWAGTGTTGVLRITAASSRPPDGSRPPLRVERFGAAQGLQTGGVGIFPANGKPYFASGGGVGGSFFAVFTFDEQKHAFVRDSTFNVVGTRRFVAAFGVVEAPNKTVYVNEGRETAVMRPGADGRLVVVDKRAFSQFADLTGLGNLYVEPDGVMWISATSPTGNRLIRYDSRMKASPLADPAVFVRQVAASDSDVIFGGERATSEPPRLPPSKNAIRFEFATPSFRSDQSNEYQSRLDGLDKDWSEWSAEPRRAYTNLGFGDYRFRVRARNASGQVSREAAYAFTILPPWYRTWWAYSLALLALGLVAFATDRIQRHRLIRKERQRAQVVEAQLRAEAAEALARSESEGKRNIEALSEIGRQITASLDFDTIFTKLYEHVNRLADADVFGIGLYHPDRHEIEYRLAIENGKRYAPYSRDTSDPNQLPVWCIEHRQPVFINDVRAEYSKYIAKYDDNVRTLEDGTVSKHPQSLIYLPLISKDRTLGIITIQSFEKRAYTEHHLSMMQNLAAYTSVALDNAAAYRQLNEQEEEIRRLLGEAERARAIAEEADAAKSAFLSTVSHELRTPLTSVLGFAKIIKKRLEDRIFPAIQTDDRKLQQTMQQVEENLKVVVSEGERLTKLIDDVLDLAKIEAGKLEWHMDSVTIADVIEHATAATASLFEPKGLTLIKNVDSTLPPVTGDRDRLIQVVINLISNAVKFTPQGSILCHAERCGGEVVVSVSDTGVGIAPADQPKVFERFKQVGDTLTDKPKGTGLGLPICREIVEHHGGRIWVESEPGKGSTFSFSLPLSAEAKATAGPVELSALIRQLRDRVVVTAPRTSHRQPRILVVDDDANIRDLLTQEFTEAGYCVSIAANGRDAIKEVRRDRPDLVVLDVMMPEMNGFDVAAVLKNDPQTLDIPIVILSIVQDKDRGFRLGVDRYLTKPIDTDLLFREVGSLIEQQKSRKRVLVVDEDATTVKTLSDVLRARGYTVTEASGDTLVEKARALQPDIIMLSSLASAKADSVRTLRFEKGLENVLFFVYQ